MPAQHLSEISAPLSEAVGTCHSRHEPETGFGDTCVAGSPEYRDGLEADFWTILEVQTRQSAVARDCLCNGDISTAIGVFLGRETSAVSARRSPAVLIVPVVPYTSRQIPQQCAPSFSEGHSRTPGYGQMARVLRPYPEPCRVCRLALSKAARGECASPSLSRPEQALSVIRRPRSLLGMSQMLPLKTQLPVAGLGITYDIEE
jgi:hypothetical protein